ncbi:MAG: hypothetical protein A2X35_11420 [Elusimicrobia bacterium GWA2_61_42]|nr:MAG: hypothetical protein A2X35_11420 [Elusimicrobia bacterium GWA2_61_42]OGR75852.1 MAG: hypothetical protein A2X38_07495 [Elusimicrobia bacterium GWC2_61_25]
MTVKKLTPILAALLALSFLPRLYAADNGTEVYMEDDLTTYGSQGTALDPDVEIKGFTVFGATQSAPALQIPAAPGNVMVNGYMQVSSGMYVAAGSTFTQAYFTGISSFSNVGNLYFAGGAANQVLVKVAGAGMVWSNLGDNLGNHTGTEALKMGVYGVNTSSDITAARYQINGSTVLAALSSGSSLAVGLEAGRTNTSGTNNNFVGYQAGYANTTGSGNNFVGWKAGFQSNGGNNNFFGNTAGQANTTGTENSYFGDNAGYSNSAGGYNAAFGNSAGFGSAATYSSVTLMGYGAGFALTSGNANTLLGYKAGYAVTTGTGNIIIGANQDTSAAAANNELNIGGAIYGNLANSRIGLGVKAPAARLEIAETNTANSAYSLRIGTGTNNFQVAVTTGGWVGLNQADPKSTLHLTGTSKDEGVIIEQAYTGVDSSFLAFLKSRGQPTSQLMPVNNDNLGVVMFMGYDGAAGDPFRESAALVGRIDGAAASGNMPGRLEFHTTPDDGSGAMAQRMVIKNNGFVGISTGNPQYMLDVYGSMNASGNICLGGDCKASWSSITGVWNKTGNTISPMTLSDTVVINSTLAVAGSAFSVGGSTLVAVNGRVGIGTMTPVSVLDVNGDLTLRGQVNSIGHLTLFTTNLASSVTVRAAAGNADTGGAIWLRAGNYSGGSNNAVGGPVILAGGDISNGSGGQYMKGGDIILNAGNDYTVGQLGPKAGSVILNAGATNDGKSGVLQFKIAGIDKAILDSSGRVGIGYTTPAALLEVRDVNASSGYVLIAGTGTSTALAITTGGVVGVGTLFPSSSTVFHAQATAVNRGPGEDVTAGMIGSVRANGTAIDDAAVGGDFEASIDGTQNLGYLAGLHTSLNRENATGGTVVNAVQIYIDALRNSGSGSITNTYGLYISTLTSGAQTNAPYAVYSEDPGARSYFAGRMGIGTTSPAAALVISSAAGSSDVMLVVSTGASVVFGVKGNGEVAAGKYFGDGSALTGVVGTDSTKVLKAGDTMSGPLNVTANAFIYSNAIVTNGIIISTGGALQTTGIGNGAISGDARGFGAVDLQSARNSNIEVASGLYSVITGGRENKASGPYTVVGGGVSNDALNTASFAGSGMYNSAGGNEAAVVGGTNNTTSADGSFIGSGNYNSITAAAAYSAIAGGDHNKAQAYNGFIGGGYYNVVSGSGSAAAGGTYNNVSGTSSVVAGGESNTASGMHSAIAGGYGNNVGAITGTIGGGTGNFVNSAAPAGTIAGGAGNAMSTPYAVIGGGFNNKSGMNGTSGQYSVIGGGSNNTVTRSYATIAGGTYNAAHATNPFGYPTIGGGSYNSTMGDYATVPGGSWNTAGGDYSFAAGYKSSSTAGGAFTWADSEGLVTENNVTDRVRFKARGGFLVSGSTNAAASGFFVDAYGATTIGTGMYISRYGEIQSTGTGRGTVTGNARGSSAIDLQVTRDQSYNVASGFASVISGGDSNTASGNRTTVGGGAGNTAGVESAVVSGGYYNQATQSYAAVGGGVYNKAAGMYSAVGGGYSNAANASSSTVSGGSNNIAGGIGAVVPGGVENTAKGNYSFAAGYKSSSTASGTFTWTDGAGTLVENTLVNQVRFKAAGGFWVSTSTSYGNPGLFVDSYNNVGIGTTTVTSKLQVAGDLGLGDGTDTGNKPVVVWLRNASASFISSGSIVVIGGGSAFVTTGVANAPAAIGVVYEPAGIAASAVGRIAIAGIASVQCNATAALGSHVVTSAVAGKADAPVNPSVIGSSIGIWLEACTSPAMGRVLLR